MMMKVEEQKADGGKEWKIWIYYPSDDRKEDTVELKLNSPSPVEANRKCVSFGGI